MDTKTRRGNNHPAAHDYEAIIPDWNLPKAFQDGDNITIEDLNAILASLAWLGQSMHIGVQKDDNSKATVVIENEVEKPKAKSKK